MKQDLYINSKLSSVKIVAVLFFSLIFFSCNSQGKDKKAPAEPEQFKFEKIVFYPIEMYIENTETMPVKTTVLIFTDKKIYQVIEKYKGEELISADTLKTVSNSDKNKKTVDGIPKKYLQKDQKFGTINVADEGAIGITFYLKNGKQVIWEMSRIKETLAKDALPLYEIYRKTNQEFNQNK